MKLYHGTSLAAATIALTQGIAPRGHAKGNWETCPSHPDLVYLTECYAPYFAMSAGAENDDHIALLEIDTELLDVNNMRPDEDFMEQVTRDRRLARDLGLTSLIKKDMVERTIWFRDHIDQFDFMWKSSVQLLGNCAYKGAIPPTAITRAVVFDMMSNIRIITGIDPTISILNYRVMGSYYKEINKWFFQPDVDVKLLGVFGMPPSALGMRHGLTVLR